MTAGMLVAGVSAWHLARGSDTEMFGRAIRIALPVVLVATLFTTVVGHGQAQLMTQQQPMKMAAAEALYDTTSHASLSAFAVAPFEAHPSRSSFDVRVPDLLSILATNSLGGTVEGINTLQAKYQARYGPGDYRPVIGVTYWSFRVMAGIGILLIVLTGYGMWLLWRGTLERSRWFLRLTTWAIALPILANTAGWLFTEMGRQPWVVYGVLRTAAGVSPSVTVGVASVLTSLVVFTLLYGALAVVDGVLMVRYAAAGPPSAESLEPQTDTDEPRPLAVAY
jgi:cytochrome d ubiquinol oxidase subunit I